MVRLNISSQYSNESPRRPWRTAGQRKSRLGRNKALQETISPDGRTSHLPVRKIADSTVTCISATWKEQRKDKLFETAREQLLTGSKYQQEGAQDLQALPDYHFQRQHSREMSSTRHSPSDGSFEASEPRKVRSKVSCRDSFDIPGESTHSSTAMIQSPRPSSLSQDESTVEQIAVPTRIIRNLSTPNVISIHRRPGPTESRTTNDMDTDDFAHVRGLAVVNSSRLTPRNNISPSISKRSSRPQNLGPGVSYQGDLASGPGSYFGSIPRRYRSTVEDLESLSLSKQQTNSPSFIPRPVNSEARPRHDLVDHANPQGIRMPQSPGNQENLPPSSKAVEIAYLGDHDKTPTKRDYATKHLSAGDPQYGPTLKVHKSAERLILGKPRAKEESVVTPKKTSNPSHHPQGYSPKAAQVLGLDATPINSGKDGPDRQAVNKRRDESTPSAQFPLSRFQRRESPSRSPPSSARQESVDRNYTGFSSNSSSIRHAFRTYGVQLPQVPCPTSIEVNVGNRKDTSDPFTEAETQIFSDMRSQFCAKEKEEQPPTVTIDLDEIQRLPTMSSTAGEGTWMSPCKKDKAVRVCENVQTEAKPLAEANLDNVGRKFDETYEDFIEDLKVSERHKKRTRKFEDSPQSFPTRTSSLQPGVTRIRRAGKLGGSPLARTTGRVNSARMVTPLQDATNNFKQNQFKRGHARKSASSAAEEIHRAVYSGLQTEKTSPRWNERALEMKQAEKQTSGPSRRGMLGTMRNMFQKRSRTTNNITNTNERERPWKGSKDAFEGTEGNENSHTSDERDRQRGQTHLEAMRRRAAASSGFPYIDNIPSTHRPTQRSVSPAKRAPMPLSTDPLPQLQQRQHQFEQRALLSQSPAGMMSTDRNEVARGMQCEEPPKTGSSTNTTASAHRRTPDKLAQAAQASLSQAERDQDREADEGLDRTMKMAREVVKQACSEDSQSPRKQKLISLGQLMVESCAAARDSFKAVHEAKMASRRAEVAHALCLRSVRNMAELLEDWKGVSSSLNI